MYRTILNKQIILRLFLKNFILDFIWWNENNILALWNKTIKHEHNHNRISERSIPDYL